VDVSVVRGRSTELLTGVYVSVSVVVEKGSGGPTDDSSSGSKAIVMDVYTLPTLPQKSYA
jgi:hypothetical protein